MIPRILLALSLLIALGLFWLGLSIVTNPEAATRVTQWVVGAAIAWAGLMIPFAVFHLVTHRRRNALPGCTETQTNWMREGHSWRAGE